MGLFSSPSIIICSVPPHRSEKPLFDVNRPLALRNCWVKWRETGLYRGQIPWFSFSLTLGDPPIQSTAYKVGSWKVQASSDASAIVLHPALLHSRNIQFRSWLIVLILHDASYIVAELSYNVHAIVHFSNRAVFIYLFIFQYIALWTYRRL